jgi:hypothetical protein
MTIKPIKTEADHAAARRRVRFLASLGMTIFGSSFLGAARGVSDCHEDARSALECGGLTPPLSAQGIEAKGEGGVKPPHSKALRAPSHTVANSS